MKVVEYQSGGTVSGVLQDFFGWARSAVAGGVAKVLNAGSTERAETSLTASAAVVQVAATIERAKPRKYVSKDRLKKLVKKYPPPQHWYEEG
jgi:hypothetical protein